MLREEVSEVISYLEKGGYLTGELQSLIEGNIEEEAKLDMVLVKGYEDIKELIDDYTIYAINETSTEAGNKGYEFAFITELSAGGYAYKNILVSGDGGLYVSDIY